MSLLDKQEVQDICGHTALSARKWSGFILNERQKIRHYRSRSTEDRRMRNSDFFPRCLHKIALYSDFIHSIDWKSAIEHDGGV